MALECADSWTDRWQSQLIHMVGSAFCTSEQAQAVKLGDAALATAQDGSRGIPCGVLCKVKQLVSAGLTVITAMHALVCKQLIQSW